LQLPSLPQGCSNHILEHRPTWGELYFILGLTPASLADFLQALLLPHLLHLSLTDRQYALGFIQQHWSTGSWQLGSDAPFVAALAGLAFVPAKVAPAAAAGSAAAARAAAATAGADGAGSSAAAAAAGGQNEQLYLAKQLFDPTVPLFAKVMATMGVAALGSAAAAGAGGNLALFPAAPFDSSGWLQVRLPCVILLGMLPSACSSSSMPCVHVLFRFLSCACWWEDGSLKTSLQRAQCMLCDELEVH
jgi:hypothetical protein